MKELLEKVSSYNFFNYLLPGTIFVYALRGITEFNLLRENILEGFFINYFIGLVISRVGSLIVEPFLKKVGYIKFAEYGKYISASQKDTKIELLSEINNMYRTILSTIIILLLGKCWEIVQEWQKIPQEESLMCLLGILAILFLFSYRKQTEYIKNRVENIKKV